MIVECSSSDIDPCEFITFPSSLSSGTSVACPEHLWAMQRWGFKNTYTFGKHLAEQLVASYHGRHFPVAIVRPSLVSGVAGKPYPGYVGNMAGGARFRFQCATVFGTSSVPLVW